MIVLSVSINFIFLYCSHSFFNPYRNLGKTDERAQTFADCARLFNDCEEAEKYSSPHEETEDNDDDKDIDDGKDEENEENGEENTQTEQPNEVTTTEKEENSNDITKDDEVIHSKTLQRFILRRRN